MSISADMFCEILTKACPPSEVWRLFSDHICFKWYWRVAYYMKRNTPRLSNILKCNSRDEKYNRRVVLWNQKPWETIVMRKQNMILHKKVRSLCITVFNLLLHAEHLTLIMIHLKFHFFQLFLSRTQRNLLALQFIL